MVCSPNVFLCKCIVPLQIEDWLITQRNCGHVVRPSFYLCMAMHASTKIKFVCMQSIFPTTFFCCCEDFLLTCWLADKQIAERNKLLFTTLQQLDYIFIFIFIFFFSIINIIMSSSSSSPSSAQISSSCPLGAQKSPNFLLAANLGGKFLMCEILFRVCWWWWRVE